MSDKFDVSRIASLARLKLTSEEIEAFTPQLDAIIHHIEALSQLDVANLEPTAHPIPVFDQLREDIPGPNLNRDLFLQNTPDSAQNQVRVPKVVDA